jgi:hypothetical protein
VTVVREAPTYIFLEDHVYLEIHRPNGEIEYLLYDEEPEHG